MGRRRGGEAEDQMAARMDSLVSSLISDGRDKNTEERRASAASVRKNLGFHGAGDEKR